ncbi:Multidrug resistance protein MdtE precursor [Phycisphaerae bacterium RAS1]|nr:Multidrug resistance protein MdtE precursor [Phycisphaerae bacterium RAS1]
MSQARRGSAGSIIVQSVTILVAGAVLIIALLALAGAFHRKIGDSHGPPPPRRPASDQAIVVARLVKLPAIESAVGTIRAVRETAVAAKILARVTDVQVQAGQRVAAGDVLVRLDDRDLKARVQQAVAAHEAAQAARRQAEVEFRRVKDLFEKNQAAAIEFERAQTALDSATAEVARAAANASEAETNLAYSVIASPIDGVVIDKSVEIGDTAQPGRTLLTLYDPTRMQLVAAVRESLTERLKVGQTIGVHIGAISLTCAGTISEIVPESQSASRSFLVKVIGPCPPGIHPGMFGRLLIPLDEREIIVLPKAAVRRIGQLDVVDVVVAGDAKTGAVGGGDELRRQVVQLGRDLNGDEVEVLSGLKAGQRVALPVPATPNATVREPVPSDRRA